MGRREGQHEAAAIAAMIERDFRVLDLRRKISKTELELAKLERRGFADCDAEALEAHLRPDGLDETGHQVVEAIVNRSMCAREYFALLVARRQLERQVDNRIRRLVAQARARLHADEAPAAVVH